MVLYVRLPVTAVFGRFNELGARALTLGDYPHLDARAEHCVVLPDPADSMRLGSRTRRRHR